jgi:hypothetical protein
MKKAALSTLTVQARKNVWFKRMNKLTQMPNDEIKIRLINRWIKECGGRV